jgi:hypothetical protein
VPAAPPALTRAVSLDSSEMELFQSLFVSTDVDTGACVKKIGELFSAHMATGVDVDVASTCSRYLSQLSDIGKDLKQARASHFKSPSSREEFRRKVQDAMNDVIQGMRRLAQDMNNAGAAGRCPQQLMQTAIACLKETATKIHAAAMHALVSTHQPTSVSTSASMMKSATATAASAATHAAGALVAPTSAGVVPDGGIVKADHAQTATAAPGDIQLRHHQSGLLSQTSTANGVSTGGAAFGSIVSGAVRTSSVAGAANAQTAAPAQSGVAAASARIGLLPIPSARPQSAGTGPESGSAASRGAAVSSTGLRSLNVHESETRRCVMVCDGVSVSECECE